MTSIFQEREEAAIQAVAARYKSLGYDVVVRPGPVLLPEPLKQFRPDLLAKNAKEKVVVEVRSKATLSEAIPAKKGGSDNRKYAGLEIRTGGGKSGAADFRAGARRSAVLKTDHGTHRRGQDARLERPSLGGLPCLMERRGSCLAADRC